MFSCKRRGRSKRQVLEFLIQALWNVSVLHLVKGDFPQENVIVYIFRIEQLREICLLIQKFLLFHDPTVTFKVRLFLKTKRVSNAETRIIFGFPELLFLSVVLLLIFIFYFFARCLFLHCVGKTILSFLILCVCFFNICSI